MQWINKNVLCYAYVISLCMESGENWEPSCKQRNKEIITMLLHQNNNEKRGSQMLYLVNT